jgi:hypothetical protein
MAGLSVTMVSIPLNLAIALGSGVPPEVDRLHLHLKNKIIKRNPVTD